jgi:hypothetical protein
MRIEANLFEVKEKIALPGGTYNALVESPKTVDKAKTGRDMMVWQFKIIDPVGPDYWNNAKLYTTKMDDPIGWATNQIKEIFDACGAHYDATSFETDDCNGKQVRIVLEQEIYQDKLQSKVVHVLKPV